MNFSTLQTKDDVCDIPLKKLIAELQYLIRNNYISTANSNLELSGKGLRITELMFKKFIIFIKSKYAEKLSDWIKEFDYWQGQDSKQICAIYFRIQKEPLVKNAFNDYLYNLERIEQVDSFEIDVADLTGLIDDIFSNMDELNRLFHSKFKCDLFCPPLISHQMLITATRIKQIDFVKLVQIIGTIIDEICDKEINALLISKPKEGGSINKLTLLLQERKVAHDTNTIDMLRTLHDIRSKIYPVHETGSAIIEPLKKISIIYPINDFKDAASKFLQCFDSCLIEMKEWFK
ncbi:MAG: hypothetical protein WA667_11620 [Candidatus Nitrosopolaris sp.]